MNREEQLDIMRHSGAHIMAQAVQRLYPNAKKAIGPTTKDGFFYDFDMDHRISEEDFEAIELEMSKIVAERLAIIQKKISKVEALNLFREMGETYKVEILEGISDDKVSIYEQGEYVDLCRGPHIDHTGNMGAFKLKAISGAYWRNDSSNKMLQRIYGYAFESKEDLQNHLLFLEEAEKRDHRKLGKELELFVANKYGPGSVFFLPKGMVLRNILEDISKKEHEKAGYQQIKTPTIMSSKLWEISGHLENYIENMYITDAEKDTFAVKPMNCPGAMLLFRNELRSYRELPFRVSEMGNVFRKELSGAVHGLMRMREFTQDDAHIFLTIEQLEDEIVKVMELIDRFYSEIFNFEYIVELSTMPSKHIGTEEQWNKAIESLEKAIKRKGVSYKINEGDGAFYGPKIDFKIKDAIGRFWQCATVQLDFNLPERFDLKYIGKDGKRSRPLIIHRAIYGSIERFMGILIEHHEGKFPLWLAPIQIIIMTISEKSGQYGSELMDELKIRGLRVEMDGSSEKIGSKIRKAIGQRIPIQIFIGEKEMESNNVSFKVLGSKESRAMKRDEFIDFISKKVEESNHV